MPQFGEQKTVSQKVAFFDAWIKSQMQVDAPAIRNRARSGAPQDKPSDTPLKKQPMDNVGVVPKDPVPDLQPPPEKQFVDTANGARKDPDLQPPPPEKQPMGNVDVAPKDPIPDLESPPEKQSMDTANGARKDPDLQPSPPEKQSMGNVDVAPKDPVPDLESPPEKQSKDTANGARKDPDLQPPSENQSVDVEPQDPVPDLQPLPKKPLDKKLAKKFSLKTTEDDLPRDYGDDGAETGPGLVGTPLGKKYVGEQHGDGWQKGQSRKTDYYSEDEKERSEVKFDKTGKASTEKGTLAGERGFVVDPETGKVHQFEETTASNQTFSGSKAVMTHHSSPLAGKDVAGAGKVKFEENRITDINDQSGHYKPKAEFTFQAVRQINLANMSGAIQAKLRKRSSQMGKDGTGRAESADTLEQLIAEEVGAVREKYFAALDEEQEKLEAKAAELPPKEQDAAFETIEQSRRQKANEFRDIAQRIENELRKDSPGGTLLHSKIDSVSIDDLSPEVQGLLKAKEKLADLIDGKEGDEALALKVKLSKIEIMLKKTAPELYGNKEAKISLLGKAGQLSDQEYTPNKNAYNRASALKQLQAPLGEAEYAKLLLKPKTDKGSAIEQAMGERNLEPGAKGSVESLKALLGKEAVDAIKDDDDEVEKLSKQYGVASIDKNFNQGPEMAGFEMGKESAVTLTAQQFLQTGGNEAQIRVKKRLMDEIQPDKDEPGVKPPLNEVKAKDSPMKKDMAGEKAISPKPGIAGFLEEVADQPFSEKKSTIDQKLENITKLIEEENKNLDGAEKGSDEEAKAESARNRLIKDQKTLEKTLKWANIEELEKDIEAAEDRYQDAEKDSEEESKANDERRALKSQKEPLEKDLMTLSDDAMKALPTKIDLEALEKLSSSAKQEMVSEISEQVEEIEKLIAAAKERLKKAKTDKDKAAKKAAKADKDNLGDDYVTLTEALEKIEKSHKMAVDQEVQAFLTEIDEAADLYDKITTLNDEIENLEDEIDEYGDEIDDLENEVEELSKQIEDLKSKNEKGETDSNKLIDLEKKIENLNDEKEKISEKRRNCKNEKKDLNKEKQELLDEQSEKLIGKGETEARHQSAER